MTLISLILVVLAWCGGALAGWGLASSDLGSLCNQPDCINNKSGRCRLKIAVTQCQYFARRVDEIKLKKIKEQHGKA